MLILAGSAGSWRWLAGRQQCDEQPVLKTVQVSGNGHVIRAEHAKEETDKVRGLSGKACLLDGDGMLFSYALPGDYCFWMKDMRFPIDMIWLDDDRKIITVRADVSPDTYPQSFCPERPAKYILETQAGVASRYGWRDGVILSF